MAAAAAAGGVGGAAAASANDDDVFATVDFGDNLAAPLLQFQDDGLTELMMDDGLTVIVSVPSGPDTLCPTPPQPPSTTLLLLVLAGSSSPVPFLLLSHSFWANLSTPLLSFGRSLSAHPTSCVLSVCRVSLRTYGGLHAVMHTQARGMGIDRLILNLLQLYCDPSMLVLVINFSPADLSFYLDQVIAPQKAHTHRHAPLDHPRTIIYPRAHPPHTYPHHTLAHSPILTLLLPLTLTFVAEIARSRHAIAPPAACHGRDVGRRSECSVPRGWGLVRDVPDSRG